MINRDGTVLYELNAQGVNRWFAGVQAGHDDSGVRTSPEDLEKIATKLSAVDELYEALSMALDSLQSVWEEEGHYTCQEDIDTIKRALAKARGEQ